MIRGPFGKILLAKPLSLPPPGQVVLEICNQDHICPAAPREYDSLLDLLKIEPNLRQESTDMTLQQLMVSCMLPDSPEHLLEYCYLALYDSISPITIDPTSLLVLITEQNDRALDTRLAKQLLILELMISKTGNSTFIPDSKQALDAICGKYQALEYLKSCDGMDPNFQQTGVPSAIFEAYGLISQQFSKTASMPADFYYNMLPYYNNLFRALSKMLYYLDSNSRTNFSQIFTRTISHIILLILEKCAADSKLFAYVSYLLVDTKFIILILKVLSTLCPVGSTHIDNAEAADNLLTILALLMKDISRVKILIHWKSTIILRRILRAKSDRLTNSCLQVIKLQLPYLGRKWITEESIDMISLIWHKCRLDLVEGYLMELPIPQEDIVLYHTDAETEASGIFLGRTLWA